MPRLNLSSNEDFVPYLKYNAKAGRFYARVEGGDGDIEIDKPRLVIDFENIKTGWIHFPQEGQPQKVWDSNLAEMAARPSDVYKRGFQVIAFGNDPLPALGGAVLGAREWCSNAGNSNAAISKMYEAYEAGLLANHGKLPFFVCTHVIPVTSKFGTNYEPAFELKGWVDRVKVAHLLPKPTSGPAHVPQHAAPRPAPAPSYAPPPTAPAYEPGLDDEVPF